ncbi:hypothetical protein CAter10_1911 [Collimonas arenae]|nr:hypothetical protein CAter10_1911 [Collimonas arenae]
MDSRRRKIAIGQGRSHETEFANQLSGKVPEFQNRRFSGLGLKIGKVHEWAHTSCVSQPI